MQNEGHLLGLGRIIAVKTESPKGILERQPECKPEGFGGRKSTAQPS